MVVATVCYTTRDREQQSPLALFTISALNMKKGGQLAPQLFMA
jgi:hypothetical protein